ncbi:hypothetical protein HGP28_14575 [Vibrio sp. SM6]|uniref:Uncharacterized protein n=1 Tax=Vibrio agarilyticus TaxID=2726741 RepID=A0A7X8TTP9_9VIBR|nr:hypothetical protein [Vibrio agarilyticus]NLS14113.1 hypothetical protein [Vibrio agarilyticus]
MNKRFACQRKVCGAALLLLTALMLIVSLVGALVAQRTTLYQIKRAHNELETRQQHWLAEGGLECAFAKVVVEQDYSQLTDANSAAYFDKECRQILGMGEITAQASTRHNAPNDSFEIRAAARSDGWGAVHRKTLIKDNSPFLGAIQSSANIDFRGDFDITPAHSTLSNAKGEYDCTALRFARRVSFTPTVSTDTLLTTPDAITCESTSAVTDKALLEGVPSDSSPFQDDYKYQPNVDTFYNYFGVRKSDSSIAALKADYHAINLSDTDDCSSQLAIAFATHDKVWMTGDCYINGPVDIQFPDKPRSLVLQDGLMATYSPMIFAGSFLQFFHKADFYDAATKQFDETKLANHWSAMNPGGEIPIHVESDSVFIETGSFYAKGGSYYDAPAGSVKIIGAKIIKYEETYKLHPTPTTAIWVKGSWNDQNSE